MSLLVQQIGAGATMQDAGRPGWRRYGVPPGGAFDRESMFIVNALLRRDTGEAVLEMAVMGATFDVLERCRISLVGARAPVRCTGSTLPSNGVFELDAGDSLTIGPMTGAARLYLACSSVGAIEPELGSVSGQEVKVGSIVGDQNAYGRWQEDLSRGAVIEPRSAQDVRQLADPPHSLYRGAMRILPGPQADWFDIAKLTGEMFILTPNCDRMGLRLAGLAIGQSPELPSEPACVGAIQVTPSGTLLILGPDGPTIGGYPKVAVVIDADLDRLAQLLPGQKVWFEIVSHEEAADLNDERGARIENLARQLSTLP